MEEGEQHNGSAGTQKVHNALEQGKVIGMAMVGDGHGQIAGVIRDQRSESKGGRGLTVR